MGCLENCRGQYVPNHSRMIYAAMGDRTGFKAEFIWPRMIKYLSGTSDAAREKWRSDISTGEVKMY